MTNRSDVITLQGTSLKIGKEYSISEIDPSNKTCGLRLVCSKKGVRFMYRGTFEGRKISQSLGSCAFCELDGKLSEVTDMALQFNERIARGKHPFEIPAEKKTLAQFFNDTYLPYATSRKKSFKDDCFRFTNHINPVLGGQVLSQISVGQVSAFLTDLHATKKLKNSTVNRVRALLSSIFSLAIDYDVTDSNPVARVKKYQENNQIERYLSDGELSSLMLVLNNPKQYGIDNLMIVSAIKLLLLTGARKREVLNLKFSDVDMERATWVLTQNKSGRTRHIPLNNDALKIIESMPRSTEYVFANPHTGKPFDNIYKTFKRILEAAKIDNFRIHDLRHNFASLAVNGGASLYLVQQLLGHASPQTTQRYSHLSKQTMLKASEDIAEVIRKASTVGIAATI